MRWILQHIYFFVLYYLFKGYYVSGLYSGVLIQLRGFVGYIFGILIKRRDIKNQYPFSYLSRKFRRTLDASERERGHPQTFLFEPLDNNKYNKHESVFYIGTFKKWVSFKHIVE
eukprot:386136_1